jgi:hypothetical protein
MQIRIKKIAAGLASNGSKVLRIDVEIVVVVRFEVVNR